MYSNKYGLIGSSSVELGCGPDQPSKAACLLFPKIADTFLFFQCKRHAMREVNFRFQSKPNVSVTGPTVLILLLILSEKKTKIKI